MLGPRCCAVLGTEKSLTFCVQVQMLVQQLFGISKQIKRSSTSRTLQAECAVPVSRGTQRFRHNCSLHMTTTVILQCRCGISGTASALLWRKLATQRASLGLHGTAWIQTCSCLVARTTVLCAGACPVAPLRSSARLLLKIPVSR